MATEQSEPSRPEPTRQRIGRLLGDVAANLGLPAEPYADDAPLSEEDARLLRARAEARMIQGRTLALANDPDVASPEPPHATPSRRALSALKHVRPLMCRAPGKGGRATCGMRAGELGLCAMHQSVLEAKVLARLLEQACPNQTPSGKRCGGTIADWDLCETHAAKLGRDAMRETLRSQLPAEPDAAAQESVERFPPLTHEQAVARLREILAARITVPAPNHAYTIPIEQLTFGGREAEGPSIVGGDAPVRFRFFERSPEGRIVARYGIEGSHAGRDMPFVSNKLFGEVTHCLRHLDYYTEVCEISGVPIRQPLAVIAHKLLRGAIDLERLSYAFVRVSPEAKSVRGREAFSGELVGRVRSLRVSPLDLAKGMRASGLGRKSVRKAIRALWTEQALNDGEVDAILDLADVPTKFGEIFIGGGHGG